MKFVKRQKSLSQTTSPRRGLTIIPVMATLTILSLLLAVMARQQVAAEKQWRMALRSAQARAIAESEKTKIRRARQIGQVPARREQRLRPDELPGLLEPVEIRLMTDADRPGRMKLSVKIPAEATSAFALIEWREP